MPTGTVSLDFGVFPGKSHATVDVAEASIGAASHVEAWVEPVATADHSADEHMLETIAVVARDKVNGVGFTVHGWNTNQLAEHEPPQFITHQGQDQAGSPRQAGQWPLGYSEGRGTRLYGVWNVGWAST